MRLTKVQSRVIALGALGLFFIVSLAISSRQQKVVTLPAPPTPLPAVNASPDAESNFVLNEFQRSETRNGVKLWEVKAKQGQYFPETNSAKLREATVWLYRKDNQSIEITTTEAIVFFSQAALGKVEGSAGVTIRYPEKGYELVTEAATFSHADDTVAASGRVEIRGPLADIRGEGLTGVMSRREFKLGKNVKTVLKPQEK